MATFTTLASRSLRLIGILDPRDTAETVDITTSKEAANAMLAIWATRKIMIPALTQQTFTLSASSASFTVGPSGDVDIVLPQKISQVILRENDIDYPLSEESIEEYNQWDIKTTESIPEFYAVRSGSPLATVYLRDIPQNEYTAILEVQTQMHVIDDVDDPVVMPAEFEEAFVYSLAVRIAPEFRVPVSQEVAAVAMESLRYIKNAKAHPVNKISMPFTSRRFDISRGY